MTAARPPTTRRPDGTPARAARSGPGPAVLAAAVAALVAVGVGLAALRSRERGDDAPAPTAGATGYVGSAACGPCHRDPHRRWVGSHHARAMERFTPATIAGAVPSGPLTFHGERYELTADGGTVHLACEGPDGAPTSRPVEYAFGVWPLRQVLVPGARGAKQAPLLAWDARDAAAGGARWYRLRDEDGRVPPTDPFHGFGPAQRWNGGCAECHATGLRKGWDPERDAYATTWVEDGVGCEACHGPGATHVAWAVADREGRAVERPPRAGLPVQLADPRPQRWDLDPKRGIWLRTPVGRPAEHIEVCARCHSHRAPLGEGDPGRSLHDDYVVSLLDEGLYFADGQVQDEVFEHGSFLQSKMWAAGVGCFRCHDHRARTREARAAAACADCHLREKFGARSHHFHAEGGPGSACVDCHMPPRTYMGVHVRRDHSIRVPRPDVSVAIGTPNACTGCHRDRDDRWAADAAARWWPGLAARPEWGTTLHAGRIGAPGAATRLAATVGDAATPGIVRATAASLLARSPDPAALDALRAAAADHDPLVRRGAVEGVVGFPPEARWAVAGPRLRDPLRSVRVAAARALAGLPAPDAAADAARGAALAEARAALGFAGDAPTGAVAVASVARAAGDLPGAVRWLERAVATSPRNVAAVVELADALRAAGRDGAARDALAAGLAVAPDAAAVHHALGLALVRASARAEAGDHFERAARTAPDDPPSVLAWALWNAEAGRMPVAVEVLAAGLARRPHDVGLLEAAAALRRAAGDLAGAAEAARHLERLRPWEPERAAARARAEAEAGR